MKYATKNKSAPIKYDAIAQLLHWCMAAILGYLMFFSHFENIPDRLIQDKIQLHSGLGLLIILLGIFRWYWRKSRPQPLQVSYPASWQKTLSGFVHHAFYALFLISPLIGVVLAGFVSYDVSVFGLFEISSWLADSESKKSLINSAHGFSADLILFLLVLHVAAALYHQFIIRNNIINRMTPNINKRM